MAKLTSSSVVVRIEAPSADLGGETVLMRIETGRYYGLDAIGSEIWRRIASPTSVQGLCNALAGDYEADRRTIEHDVETLLLELARHGLIEVRT